MHGGPTAPVLRASTSLTETKERGASAPAVQGWRNAAKTFGGAVCEVEAWRGSATLSRTKAASNAPAGNVDAAMLATKMDMERVARSAERANALPTNAPIA